MRTITAIIIALVVGSAACAQDKELVDALQKLDARVFKPDSADAKLRWDSVRKLREDVNKKDVESWRTIETKHFTRDVIVAGVSLVFSILFIWYSRNTGNSFWVYWAPFLLAGGAMLLGIPVYAAQRTKMTEPDPVPAYR